MMNTAITPARGQTVSCHKPFLIIALLLASVSPMKAQSDLELERSDWAPAAGLAARLGGSLPLMGADSAKPLSLVALRPARGAVRAFPGQLRAPMRELPTYPERTNDLLPLTRSDHNHDASIESAVGYSETPFAEELRTPMAWFLGGRLQFGPFYSFRQTENVLLGLPGSGSLPAWSVGMQNHPGLLVPLADESYGLSLSLRIKRQSEPVARIHMLRCLAKVLGTRGCVSN